MQIIAWRPLREFSKAWPAASGPLEEWYKITEGAHWRNFADLKQTFGQTDLAKVASGQTVCVFDVGGNKFRLVCFISYPKGKVYVLRVMTHKEYDKGNQRWKEDL